MHTLTFDPQHMDNAYHELTSEYVELYWLPLIGPTSFVLLRAFGRIYQGVQHRPNKQTRQPLAPIIEATGIAYRHGKSSAMQKTLNRLERFAMIQQTAPDALTITAYLPNISHRQLETLPQTLQALHSHQFANA